MTSILTLTVITIGFFKFATSNTSVFLPASPCPDVFQYNLFNQSDGWMALVYVRPPMQSVPIKLDVFLYLEAVLPTKYVGILELVEPRSVVLSRLAQSVDYIILYVIRFPLQNPLPKVKKISVNNVQLCIGAPVVGPIITTIHLEHSLYRMSHPVSSYVPNSSERKSTENRSNRGQPSSLKGLVDASMSHEQCGQTASASVATDKTVVKGEWPWLVAIFISQPIGLQFHCCGTLLSDQYVITAGHCVDHEQTGLLTPDSILVYLGKHSIRNWTEPNSLLQQVIDVHIHPTYNKSNFTADLALLKFVRIKFTANIKPACIWSGSVELNSYVRKIGTVVGWGRDGDEMKIKNEPRRIQLQIASQEECLRSKVDFIYLTSENTLCAGSRNGTGPCNGDSGAGLLLLNEQTNKWELRGIVSLSLVDANSRRCDLSEYVIFTDTAKFLNWITQYVT